MGALCAIAADARTRFADNAMIHGCMSFPLGAVAEPSLHSESVLHRSMPNCGLAPIRFIQTLKECADRPSDGCGKGAAGRVGMLDRLRNKMKLAVNFPSPPAV